MSETINTIVDKIIEMHREFPQAEDIPPMLRKEKVKELRVLREDLAKEYAALIIGK
jgi:hypothetical protein